VVSRPARKLSARFPAGGAGRVSAASKQLFEKLSVPTPRDYPEASFPLIAKPVDASGSRDVRCLENPADLARFFPDGIVGPGWVVEEFCPGPSYSLEVTGRPGAYKTWTVTRLFMDQDHDCRQVICPSGLSRTEEEEFRALSLCLAEGLGLTGLMDVEVILTPGGFRVLEIDARLPSQTPTAIYWATGDNLLVHLASLFDGPDPTGAEARSRAVIYEQVASGAVGLESVGEHRLSLAGPLRWEDDFCGADLALTDWSNDRPDWVAALVITGQDMTEAEGRRREVLARLSRTSGRPLTPSLKENRE
jgi:pyrrolysine biosynthesis protein PylC